jgi:hypothetical protein
LPHVYLSERATSFPSSSLYFHLRVFPIDDLPLPGYRVISSFPFSFPICSSFNSNQSHTSSYRSSVSSVPINVCTSEQVIHLLSSSAFPNLPSVPVNTIFLSFPPLPSVESQSIPCPNLRERVVVSSLLLPFSGFPLLPLFTFDQHRVSTCMSGRFPLLFSSFVSLHAST